MEKRGTTNQRATSLGTRRCHGCVRTLLGRLCRIPHGLLGICRVRRGVSYPWHTAVSASPPRCVLANATLLLSLLCTLLSTFVVVHPFSSFHRLFVHPTTFDSTLLVQSFLLVPFHPLSLSIYLYPSFSPSLPFLPSPLYPSLSLCLCLSHRHSRFPALSKINTSQRGLKTCVNMVLHCLYVHITLSARLLPPTRKPAGHFTTPYRRAR